MTAIMTSGTAAGNEPTAVFNWDEASDEERAVWSAAFINDLPDSSFAYIEPGGKKDEDGKTTPRSLRHFPHHGPSGAVDLPHLRNALARASQSPFGAKALGHLKAHARDKDVGEQSSRAVNAIEHRQTELIDLQVERRADENQGPRLAWYPAVFNDWSVDLGGFRERFHVGAFRKTLREADIHALVNHDRNLVLGRNISGTLTLREDRRGLKAEVELPNTGYANDLVEIVGRGDISQGSIAFRVPRGKDKWDKDPDNEQLLLRDVYEAGLADVSIVVGPAYPTTDGAVVMRSVHELAEAGINVDQLAAAILRARAGEPLAPAERAILQELSPLIPTASEPAYDHSEERSEPPTGHSLAWLRRKFELELLTA